MKYLITILILLTNFLSAAPKYLNGQKHRLIILADMGNEPDEVQQMAHLLIYCNEFDLEGLIAVTSIHLHPQQQDEDRRMLHPELFHTLIDAYEKVYNNLTQHASGWKTPAYLRSIVTTGQKGYGLSDIGDGKTSPGSKLITDAVLKNDPRPVYIVINAGSNTLAQALHDYRATHTEAEVRAFIKKIIVYENGAQDNAGAWIAQNFPDMQWIRSNDQTYGYMGRVYAKAQRLSSKGPHTWKPYAYTDEGQHEWSKEHIQTKHGALGEAYPDRVMKKDLLWFLEGGGTAPWLGLITRGLSDPWHPGWGGWSGRYTHKKQKNILSRHEKIAASDTNHQDFYVYSDSADFWTDPETGKTYNDIYTPIHRWRKHIQEDFKARMDWCLAPYDKVNHNPVAALDGNTDRVITVISAKAREKLSFDASASYDPDKGQKVSFNWWIYKEAGTYEKKIKLKNANSSKVEFKVPGKAAGKQIHLILDVYDNSPIAMMHDYRRIVININ